jgi:hypothetical protein
MTTVSSGVIIPATPAITEPGAITPIRPGSIITAAGQANADKTAVQTEAIKNLGGKVGGRRRAGQGKTASLARVRRLMLLGGASAVPAGRIEVKNVPNMVSSGSVNAKDMYAGLLETHNQMAADAQFDGLGHSSPQQLAPLQAQGGRRRGRRQTRQTKKKTRKHHNGKTKHATVRKSRRAGRRTRRIRAGRS